MDGVRFDAVIRSLTATRSRRRTMAAALGSLLTIGTLPADAKKKKKKSLLRQGATTGACAPLPPPTPSPPTCTDGVLNGTESDVDCGGACPRRGDDKRCASGGDGESGFCTGRCQRCSTSPNTCNPDALGPCFCRSTAGGNLRVRSSILAASCDECPVGTGTCEPVGLASGFLCFPLCGTA